MTRQMLFASILICGAWWWARGQTNTTVLPINSASEKPTDADLPFTEALIPPMPVVGVRAPLRLSSETRSNFVMGGIQVATAYDDNMLSSRSQRIGDLSYLFFPTLELVQTRERWHLDAAYSPGFTINQRLNERNQAAHDLHFLISYRMTPHVDLQVHDNFSKTTTLFSEFLAGAAEQPGPLQQPNTSPILPIANQTRNTSGLDLTYQFGRNSIVGASGGYSFVNYGTVEGTSGGSYRLFDNRSWNANGFYTHRFAGRHWLGLCYNVQRLMFDPSLRTDVQRVLLFYSIALSADMSLSLWAGPERSTSYLPLPPAGSASTMMSTAQWDSAGGADWNWEGTRTGLRVGYIHQTTDGGGWAQAVNMQAANAEVRHRLTHRWTASVGTMYAKNDPLHSNSFSIYTAYGTRTLSGAASIEYQMTDNLGLGLHYGRYQQNYNKTTLTSSAFRNRAWFSIGYSFNRPLGR